MQKSVLGLLFSPATLAPVVLGLGSALVLGARSDEYRHLAMFLTVAGTLGGVGTLLTMMMFNGPRRPPEVVRRRKELLSCLAELADSGRFIASVEADQQAVAAQVERL